MNPSFDDDFLWKWSDVIGSSDLQVEQVFVDMIIPPRYYTQFGIYFGNP
jgi:hypothetical protein